MHFYVERKGKLKCTLSEYHCLLHLPVGKITLKPLQEFRNANKSIQAPFVAGLWIEVSTMSTSETQGSGAKYSEVILARRGSRWLPQWPPFPGHPSVTFQISHPVVSMGH